MTDPVLLHHLSSIENRLRNLQTDINDILDKHDERLDTVETMQNQQRGAFRLASALAIFFSGFITVIINKFWP